MLDWNLISYVLQNGENKSGNQKVWAKLLLFNVSIDAYINELINTFCSELNKTTVFECVADEPQKGQL